MAKTVIVNIEMEIVEPVDPERRTSPIAPPGNAICYYNGQEYSTGAVICQEGRKKACDSNGQWQDLGTC